MSIGNTSSNSTNRPAIRRIIIAGCGGVGGVVTSKLARAGFQVTAVTHNETIAASVRQHGLRASFQDGDYQVEVDAVPAVDELDGSEPFDLALLAVPPNAILEAANSLLPVLRDRAPLVPFANGLPEEALRDLVEEGRIVGGVVAFGATMHGPGQVEQTSQGGFTIGRLKDRAQDDTLDAVAEVLETVGPVQRASNLRGARWSKLAINCAISSLGAIGGDTLGALMRKRFVRRLALEAMTEVVHVARTQDVHLEKVAGTLNLDWLALQDDERLRLASPGLVAKHAVLLAVGARYRRMRSSMLRAIERGRKPPVEQLNGEVTRRGAAVGVETPINQALLDEVLAIAAGDGSSSVQRLESLYQRTRPVLRQLEMVA